MKQIAQITQCINGRRRIQIQVVWLPRICTLNHYTASRSIHPCIHLSTHVSQHPLISPCIQPKVHPTIHQSNVQHLDLINPSIDQMVQPSFIQPFIHLPIHPSIYLCTHHLMVNLSKHPINHMFTHSSKHPTILSFDTLSITHASNHPSSSPSIQTSNHLPVHLSIHSAILTSNFRPSIHFFIPLFVHVILCFHHTHPFVLHMPVHPSIQPFITFPSLSIQLSIHLFIVYFFTLLTQAGKLSIHLSFHLSIYPPNHAFIKSLFC